MYRCRRDVTLSAHRADRVTFGLPPDDSAVPADSAEAPAPAAAPGTAPVAPAAKAARSRSRHVARREGHSYSGRSSYSPRYYSNRQVHQAGGYAGLW